MNAADIRAYAAQHPGASPTDVAAATGSTEALALQALAERGWALSGANLDDVLAEIGSWDRALVLVRNGDAVAEVEVNGGGWYWKGDWLNWVADGHNLHIRARNADAIVALIRSGRNGYTYSFNFADRAGRVFWRVYARSEAARERFIRYCEARVQAGQACEMHNRVGLRDENGNLVGSS
jgi:putative heme iron utilization protein